MKRYDTHTQNCSPSYTADHQMIVTTEYETLNGLEQHYRTTKHGTATKIYNDPFIEAISFRFGFYLFIIGRIWTDI